MKRKIWFNKAILLKQDASISFLLKTRYQKEGVFWPKKKKKKKK